MKRNQLVAFILSLSCSCTCSLADISYSYVEIPHFGPGMQGNSFAINDNGQATGESMVVPYHNDGFLWDNGTMTDLGHLGASIATVGHDINNSAQIVGSSSLGPMGGNWQGYKHAILWENGVLADLGTVSGTDCSVARSINESGVIVGKSYNFPGGNYADMHAVMWKNGAMTNLNPYFGMDESNGMAINDHGQIAAAAWNTGSSDNYGYLLNNGVLTSLGNLYPHDLNNSGVIIGSTKTATGNHAALWDGGTITDLTDLTGYGDYASSINDHGDIIMIEGGSLYTSYLWSNGTLTNLNEVISDLVGIPTGSLHINAHDINIDGQITGYWRESGVYAYNMFVLTPNPVPVPGAFLLGSIGLSLAGWKLRRRRVN